MGMERPEAEEAIEAEEEEADNGSREMMALMIGRMNARVFPLGRIGGIQDINIS